jgi:type II secretory pathway component PulM
VNLRELWGRVVRWYAGHETRDRRILAAVGIAVALYLVDVALIEPVRGYRQSVADEIAAGEEALERAARFAAAVPGLKAERDELRRRLEQAKTRLLPGGTGTLGAAALQEKTNSIAAEKGVTVQSTQVMKEEVVEPFRKVAVRLTLSSELKPLAELLAAIEYGQQLSVPFIEISRRGAVAGQKGPRTLQASVEVDGFVESGKKPEPSKAEEAAPASQGGTAPEPVPEPSGGPGAEPRTQ